MIAAFKSQASFERATEAPDGRLRGSQVLWARVAWLILVASVVIPWALTLPEAFADYLIPCVDDCALTPRAAEALLRRRLARLYA